jgi:phage baseplate assembly protein gpV
MLETLETTPGVVHIQSSHTMSGGEIHIASIGEKLLIAAIGNDATNVLIDSDTKIDSDIDGVPDNDIDNKNSPSYGDGTAFEISTRDARTHTRSIRITLMKNNEKIGSRDIKLIFDSIPDTSLVVETGLTSS